MRSVRFLVAALLVSAFSVVVAAQPQNKNSRPSPPATASVDLAGTTVKIDYSAPSMRGRKIFGGLQPYDHWWRLGANEATALTTSGDLDINGTRVPAGNYTLFAIPSEGTWKLIVSKATGEWGTLYDPSKDLARIDMKKNALSSPQEKMSITFEHTSGKSTQMHARWENTDAWVPVNAK